MIHPRRSKGDSRATSIERFGDLPIEALDDPGFWRYLSLVDFWWFVKVREARGDRTRETS